MHPNNHDETGSISPRSFTFVNSHVVSYGTEHENAFYVDDTGIYYGARLGIKRWDFDWSNETTIVSTPSPYCQTFVVVVQQQYPHPSDRSYNRH